MRISQIYSRFNLTRPAPGAYTCLMTFIAPAAWYGCRLIPQPTTHATHSKVDQGQQGEFSPRSNTKEVPKS